MSGEPLLKENLAFVGFWGSIPGCGCILNDGSYSPRVDLFQDVGVRPQVASASFFEMAIFWVALASTASTSSRCGFHVKRVSRVTPRNVFEHSTARVRVLASLTVS